MKKCKKVNLYLFILGYVLICCCCNPFKPRFERNPNLRLLLQKEGKSLFNPVWSPDGIRIYYLAARSLNGALDYAAGGDLWCINADGSNDRFLLSGKFCSLAISSDGSKLALSYEDGSYANKFEGGPLIVIDKSGAILDTLPTNLSRILDVKFGSTGTNLVFYAYSTESSQSDSSGFYSIDVDGTNEQLLKTWNDWGYMAFVGFDLNSNDSIFHSTGGGDIKASPQFNPSDDNYMVYATTGVPYAISELVLLNMLANSIDTLDADPFHSIEDVSGILSAYWSPDGNRLVISVGEIYNDLGTGTLELWILEKVWE